MSESMQTLKRELVDLAISMEAVGAKIANRAMLEGPASADPIYVFTDTQSVISFAIPLGHDFIPDYFGKKSRLVFKQITYDKYLLSGAISDAISAKSQQRGFRAVSISPNGVYRPEKDGSRPGFLIPDFSLRYAAVASIPTQPAATAYWSAADPSRGEGNSWNSSIHPAW